jgi:hypothetical protein
MTRTGARLPDFYIAGAPRSGTTALYTYLRQHPAIFMPERKEPCFHCRDLDTGALRDEGTFIRDPAEYAALFAAAGPDQVVGEACVWYLYSTVAADRIRAETPNARVIAMLRDPVEMIHSLHERRVLRGAEDLEDFEQALDAEADRRAGRRIPVNSWNIKAYQYRAVGRYAEQVERYLTHLPADRVKVIIFDDFIRDTPAVYRDVLDFLGVDPDFRADFAVVNANARVGSRRLRDLVHHPQLLRTYRRLVPEPLRAPFRAAAARVDEVNTRPARRPPMPPHVRARLREEYADEIARLSSLIGRDLTRLWA